jgi:hypothetical protein
MPDLKASFIEPMLLQRTEPVGAKTSDFTLKSVSRVATCSAALRSVSWGFTVEHG